jgi:cell division protein FtsX
VQTQDKPDQQALLDQLGRLVHIRGLLDQQDILAQLEPPEQTLAPQDIQEQLDRLEQLVQIRVLQAQQGLQDLREQLDLTLGQLVILVRQDQLAQPAHIRGRLGPLAQQVQRDQQQRPAPQGRTLRGPRAQQALMVR